MIAFYLPDETPIFDSPDMFDLDELLRLKAIEQAALDFIAEVENDGPFRHTEFQNLKELTNYNGNCWH